MMVDNVTKLERPIRWAKLRQDEAERVIRERAVSSENIIITDHAYDRVEDRSIIRPDIERILREGYVDASPQKDEHGSWIVQVKKVMRGGREAAVVSAIVKEDSKIIVVTVMWVDPS